MREFIVTFTEDEYKEGIEVHSINKGFSAIELMGLLEMKLLDVREQLRNEPKFKRYFVHKDGTKEEIVEKGEDTQ